MTCCHLPSVTCDNCRAQRENFLSPGFPSVILYGKVPHKCPVCLGEGERLDKEKIEMVKCKACINGIVWG